MTTLLERQLRASLDEIEAQRPIPYTLTARGHGLAPIEYSPRLRVLCSCGHWLKWYSAPLVGSQCDDVQELELRNCPHCGSTRAIVTHERRDADA